MYVVLRTVHFMIMVVYCDGGYSEIVEKMTEDSMNDAVKEVKALPDYATKGEVMF